MFASLALVDGLVVTIFFNVKSPNIAYLQGAKLIENKFTYSIGVWTFVFEIHYVIFLAVYISTHIQTPPCSYISMLQCRKLTEQFQQIVQASSSLLKAIYRVLPLPKYKKLIKYKQTIFFLERLD